MEGGKYASFVSIGIGKALESSIRNESNVKNANRNSTFCNLKKFENLYQGSKLDEVVTSEARTIGVERRGKG